MPLASIVPPPSRTTFNSSTALASRVCVPVKSMALPVATCFCPIQEGLDAQPTPAGTPFLTQAGQCQQSICSQFPVGGPFQIEDISPGQCIEFPTEDDR